MNSQFDLEPKTIHRAWRETRVRIRKAPLSTSCLYQLFVMFCLLSMMTCPQMLIRQGLSAPSMWCAQFYSGKCGIRLRVKTSIHIPYLCSCIISLSFVTTDLSKVRIGFLGSIWLSKSSFWMSTMTRNEYFCKDSHLLSQCRRSSVCQSVSEVLEESWM